MNRENWKTVKVEDVCEKGSSNIAQNEIETNSGDYPIYGAAGFIKNVDFYKQEKPYIGIVKDGAGVGRVSVHPAKSSIIGTMQYILPKDNVEIGYLAAFLKSKNLGSLYKGAAIPHIYFKDYQNLEIPLPPLDVQKQIALNLDQVTKVIAEHKELLAKYDLLIKSRFIEMFGDPVTNPMGWEVKQIQEVAPAKQSSKILEDKVWLLNLDMIESQTGRIIDYLYVDKDEIGNSTYIFDTNNVLYSKLRPYLNKVVIPTKYGVCTSELVPLYPTNELNRYFLAELLRTNSFVSFINEKVAGAKMPRVSMDVFRKFECILPPLELQQQFADFVQQIDKSKLVVQQSLEKAETLYKSLMQEYFG